MEIKNLRKAPVRTQYTTFTYNSFGEKTGFFCVASIDRGDERTIEGLIYVGINQQDHSVYHMMIESPKTAEERSFSNLIRRDFSSIEESMAHPTGIQSSCVADEDFEVIGRAQPLFDEEGVIILKPNSQFYDSNLYHPDYKISIFPLKKI